MAVETGYHWEYQDKTQPYIQAWNPGSQIRYNTIPGGDVGLLHVYEGVPRP